MPAPSYVHGASAVPLLGETIGDNLRRTVERVGDREALVVRAPGLPRDLPRALGRRRRGPRAGLLARGVQKGDRVGIWAPNRFEWVVVQYATARIGAILVNINPAYKTAELEYVLQPVRDQPAAAGPRVPADRLRRACWTQVRGRCPELRESLVLDDDWDALLDGWRAGLGRRPARSAEATLQFDDPINIQYTSGTTGFPKGATLSHHNILNNGFFVGEALRYTERDRVCIPVPFYHCFGMVLGNLACTTHGARMVVPGEALRPAGGAGDGPGRALHVAVRRADDVHRASSIIRASASSTCTIAADRHHGRLAVPGRGDEAGPVADAHARGDHLLRHDRDRRRSRRRAAPTIRSRSACRRSAGCIRTSRSRSSTRPTGAIVPRGAAGELCTRGYSVMLGYWNDEEATSAAIDAGALDAHRRPGDDGRRRLRQHRRPDQGHDHPRRREHLPARDRGVPVHASRTSATSR